MQNRYTIVVTDGKLQGASVHADDAKAAKIEDISIVAPEINGAALAKIEELEATIKADKEASDALLEATKADAAKQLAEATAVHSQAMAETQKTIVEAAPALQAAQSEIEALKAEVVRLTPPPVPPSIKAWQAKAVLQLAALLEPAEAIIAGLSEPNRTVVSSAWSNNADFSRQSPTITSLATALGLSDDQLDAMFQQAAALTV